MKLNKYRKGLAVVATTALFLTTLLSASASAATLTSITLTPSDPRVSTSNTYTLGFSSATGTVRCVRVHFSTSTTFSGTLPTGMSFATPVATVGATAFTTTNTSDYVQGTDATGVATPSAITITNVTNASSSGSNYAYIETFSNVGCTTALDTGTVGFAITDGTTVSVTVNPSFSFTVADNNGACNGETNTAGAVTNGTSVALGSMPISASRGDAQLLTVGGNAGGGYSVYVRSTNNQALRSAGHNWVDGGGAWGGAGSALTGAGTEQFAVYPHDNDNTGTVVTATPASGNAYTLTTTTTNKVMDSTASSGTGCLGFVANTGTSTPAGSYTATVIYTAVPTF